MLPTRLIPVAIGLALGLGVAGPASAQSAAPAPPPAVPEAPPRADQAPVGDAPPAPRPAPPPATWASPPQPSQPPAPAQNPAPPPVPAPAPATAPAPLPLLPVPTPEAPPPPRVPPASVQQAAPPALGASGAGAAAIGGGPGGEFGGGAAMEGPGGPVEAPVPSREQLSASRVRPESREESRNPFRQSVLLFDQSMTTQTVDFGPTPLSYVPLYELWFSFRPRYSFDEHWSVRGRFDYTKELTNQQQTTYLNEDIFGDIWTDLVYGAKLDALWRDTRVNAGVRALWPTSKASQGAGTYVKLGLRGAAEHQFQLRGPDAPSFSDFHVGVAFSYLHPFTTATTPTSYGGFGYTRQDVDDRSFVSDQLTGQTVPEHILWFIVDSGLQITPRLSFSAALVFINEWHYAPTDTPIRIANGSVQLSSAGDNQYIASHWFTTELEYELFDEVGLSIGYYNLTNALAPDGSQRTLFGPQNIWWSPDARFFLDITANLDVLFDDARGRAYSKPSQVGVGTRNRAPRPTQSE